MDDVSVTLLSGFAATVEGVPVPDGAWRLKKARELIKLLALAPGQRLHREQAMDVLWRDRAPAAAANNLNQVVHAARHALGSAAIEVRDQQLRLVAEVDVTRLELAAADARRAGTPAAYRAALALYPGELLPENRYDDWVEDRRDALAELAADLAETLAAIDPVDRERPRSLPADASSFIGRERELTELHALLRDTRLLTLAGTGGVGKTRLVLELARGAETSFPNGAALVELAAITDAGLVSDAVAATLDVRALSGQRTVDAVVEFLALRSMLLVVDNCEHVLGATAKLTDALLRGAPALTILATSREPLRVPGEVVFRVPSLDIPDPERTLDPDQLLDYEAVRLFVERATAAAPGFALDEHNAVDIASICFRLDGLPLALELAAGRLGALGPAAIAERLDDRFRLLRTTSHASPTRQQTLAATLQWSHDLLEPDERALFRRLGAFAGSFELEAVESVCSGGELDAAGVADVLARLVEKSLVVVDDGGSRKRRYRLLETVRAHARERLDGAREAFVLAECHAGWALSLAEREQGSPRLDRDAANLRAALDTLLGSEPSDALRLCLALWPFWMRRIDLGEARRRFDEALAAAPERTALRAQALLAAASIDFRSGVLQRGLPRAQESLAIASEIKDPRAEWKALRALGEFSIAVDAIDVALPWLERALELARREGFATSEAVGVYSLGVAHWVRGDLAQAEELLARSVAKFDALARSPEKTRSLLNISQVRTRYSNARPGPRIVFEDTLQPFLEISCDLAAGYARLNQASIARVAGEYGRARALLDESAARFEQAADQRGRAAVLVRRAYLELAEGAIPAARAALALALELRREQADRRGVGLILAGLGLIETTAGDHDSAEQHLAEARDIFRRAGDRWGLASTLWRTADLAFAIGSLDDAEAALQEARTVLGPTGRERWIANTIAALAEVAVLRGEPAQAAVLLADARRRYAARDDALGVADADERLATLQSPG